MIYNTFPSKVKYSTLQNFNFSKPTFLSFWEKLKLSTKELRAILLPVIYMMHAWCVALDESVLEQNFHFQFEVG